MSSLAHGAMMLMALSTLLIVGSGGYPRTNGAQTGDAHETRFWTGCEPGPSHPPPPREHLQTSVAPPGPIQEASLRIDLNSAAGHRPILGSGFNLEHALWSCPEFRRLLRPEILDPFMPALVRVDTGLLPAAPPQASADELGEAVYASMLDSAPYADSWQFVRRLNRAGVRVVLGVWGGPAQFTDDGTRLGQLLPAHYDDYVDYVGSVVDYLAKRQQIQIWAITIANEPDGGDGNEIPPEGLPYIAHRLAQRLAPLGVKLYGPDTASAASAMHYLPGLLDDPLIADNLAFIGFHEYYASADVASVVDYVRTRRPELPVIVTEYTSFGFGDLDDGQEVNDGIGFTLDIANMLLAHYRYGADAALYWDAVDYLQPGHDAITRWGLLRGPSRDFARRSRYYALLQILPYLQPGSQVLTSQVSGAEIGTLAVRTPSGEPAMFLVNRAAEDVELQLDLTGAGAGAVTALSVWRTDRTHSAERLGRVRLQDGTGTLWLPGRSLTTLFPTGAAIAAADSG